MTLGRIEKEIQESHKKDAAARALVGVNVTAALTHPADWHCPSGFSENVKNLQGKSGLRIQISEANSTELCARECCKQEGCTSFEFGTDSKYKGCWTYQDGNKDLKWKDQYPQWISCIKNDDPGACAFAACPAGYVFQPKNLQGKGGLKELEGTDEINDTETCAQKCCGRENCTSFEVGTTTKYRGCWTYTDGQADVKFAQQLANWTSCTRTSAPPCPPPPTPVPTTPAPTIDYLSKFNKKNDCHAIGTGFYAPMNITIFAYPNEKACQNAAAEWCLNTPHCASFDCSSKSGPIKPQFFTSVECGANVGWTHFSKKSFRLAIEDPLSAFDKNASCHASPASHGIEAPANVSIYYMNESACQAAAAKWCLKEPDCASFDCSSTASSFKPLFFNSSACHSNADWNHFSKKGRWSSNASNVSEKPLADPLAEPLAAPPAEPLASASGDPHLSNTRGERFDIYKSGRMEFLRVPYDSAAIDANFTVLATIEAVKESIHQCDESRYITSLLFGGAWLEDRLLRIAMQNGQMEVLLGGVQVKPSADARPIGKMVQLQMPEENQVHVGVGGMWIDVSRDLQPVHYFLNMQARSLATSGYRIGGLLGEDDHVAVSTPPPGCEISRLTAVRTTRRIDASARMTP
jgi:hypothetical protein